MIFFLETFLKKLPKNEIKDRHTQKTHTSL